MPVTIMDQKRRKRTGLVVVAVLLLSPPLIGLGAVGYSFFRPIELRIGRDFLSLAGETNTMRPRWRMEHYQFDRTRQHPLGKGWGAAFNLLPPRGGLYSGWFHADGEKAYARAAAAFRAR